MEVLREAVYRHASAHDDARLEEPHPQPVAVDDGTHDQEICAQVKNGDIPLHTLKIAPEALERIDAERGRNARPYGKREDGPQHIRGARPVLRIAQRQNNIEREYDLDDDAKNEIL